MKKVIFLTFISTYFLLSLTGGFLSARRIFSFVGIDVCGKCHGGNSIGNQVKIWATSPHAKAFQILRTGKSYEIAKKHSIQNPDSDEKCLKCHTTGAGKSSTTNREGVGCEACHGPGSGYFEFSNHASFNNRENAYRRALKLGMYPIIGLNGIKAREKLCRHCHRMDRPCTPEDVNEKKRQELPLSLIADFVFKHPLRR